MTSLDRYCLNVGTNPEADQGVPQPELFHYLQKVLTVLSPSSVQYCVIGAVALGAWGRARATGDLDILVLADPQESGAIIAALSAANILINHPWAEANPMAKGRVTRFRSPDYPDYPLDIIYAADSQERSALERKRRHVLNGVPMWVVGPEDLMLLKLKAGRGTDFDDVISVVKNPRLQLDMDYLWQWADRLGLQGELQYVLQAADAGKGGVSF